MSYDYTQDFIDNVKGCLDGAGGGLSEEEIDEKLESYSPKDCPVHQFPANTSAITLMPNSVFSGTSLVEYLPFAIINTSREDDSENHKQNILQSLRNFFDVNTFRSMYNRILENNGVATPELYQKIQNMDLVELFYDFLKIEVRSTDPVGYCTMYTLQRMPMAQGQTDDLTTKFKLSWLGADANMYYTVVSVVVDSRPAYFVNTIEATDIAAEGTTVNKPVQIIVDDEMIMEPSSLAVYIHENVESVFGTVYETYKYTDPLAFAQNVREFDIEFLYQPDGSWSYGVSHVVTVRFVQRSMYMDKSDQWLPWPVSYDFSYRGEIEDADYKQIVDVSYMCERTDSITTDADYDCRIGTGPSYNWI